MRNEKEIRLVMKELEDLTEATSDPTIWNIVSEGGLTEIHGYACTVYETLSWVLGYIESEEFKSEYIKMDALKSSLE